LGVKAVGLNRPEIRAQVAKTSEYRIPRKTISSFNGAMRGINGASARRDMARQMDVDERASHCHDSKHGDTGGSGKQAFPVLDWT
jgi:hypothetical protein